MLTANASSISSPNICTKLLAMLENVAQAQQTYLRLVTPSRPEPATQTCLVLATPAYPGPVMPTRYPVVHTNQPHILTTYEISTIVLSIIKDLPSNTNTHTAPAGKHARSPYSDFGKHFMLIVYNTMLLISVHPCK